MMFYIITETRTHFIFMCCKLKSSCCQQDGSWGWADSPEPGTAGNTHLWLRESVSGDREWTENISKRRNTRTSGRAALCSWAEGQRGAQGAEHGRAGLEPLPGRWCRGLARTGLERGNTGSSAAPARPGTPPPCRGSPGQRCRPPSTRGRYLEERGGPAALGEQHQVRARARLQAQPGAVAAGARPAQREALAQRRHLGQARLSRELERRAHPRVTRGGAGRGRDRPGAVATGSARWLPVPCLPPRAGRLCSGLRWGCTNPLRSECVRYSKCCTGQGKRVPLASGRCHSAARSGPRALPLFRYSRRIPHCAHRSRGHSHARPAVPAVR